MEKEIAVLMAAGLGSRMRPLTDSLAKPLVKIKGIPLIETMITGLEQRKVEKIYIVVGYRKEQFSYLTTKYENVVLVENKEYLEKNNISSIYAVCDRLGECDCFICESDIYVQNKQIFQSRLQNSCYFGRMVAGYSPDWAFRMENNRIVRIQKGGTDTYNMTGVAFLKKEDAGLLAETVRNKYFQQGISSLFWDEVLDGILDKIEMHIHPVRENDLVEADTIRELAMLDAAYQKYLTGAGKEIN